jgi:hypothetical protein
MADETGISGRPAKDSSQAAARKGARQVKPARQAASRKPTSRDTPDNPGELAPVLPAPVPDTETLERLRSRLMVKYHGRRR